MNSQAPEPQGGRFRYRRSLFLGRGHTTRTLSKVHFEKQSTWAKQDQMGYSGKRRARMHVIVEKEGSLRRRQEVMQGWTLGRSTINAGGGAGG